MPDTTTFETTNFTANGVDVYSFPTLYDIATAELWVGDEVLWDKVILGSFILPGTAKVEVKSGRKIDVKQGAGSDGAVITDRGYEPAKIDIKLQMWLAGHKEQLVKVLDVIHPRKKEKKRLPLDIDHAATRIMGIKSVYIEKIDGPSVGGTAGVKELTISCIEWIQPPKKKSTKDVTATPTLSMSGADWAVDGTVRKTMMSTQMANPY